MDVVVAIRTEGCSYLIVIGGIALSLLLRVGAGHWLFGSDPLGSQQDRENISLYALKGCSWTALCFTCCSRRGILCTHLRCCRLAVPRQTGTSSSGAPPHQLLGGGVAMTIMHVSKNGCCRVSISPPNTSPLPSSQEEHTRMQQKDYPEDHFLPLAFGIPLVRMLG